MLVLKYHSILNRPARAQHCVDCNPIIFQVFFSDFEDDELTFGQPRYFDFDFADNGYGKFKAEFKERAAEEKAYNERMNELYSADTIETRSISEIERYLIALVPVEPDLYKAYTAAYEACKKGHEYFHQQNYANAIECYRVAVDNHCTDHIAFCLSLSYYLQGDYTNSLAIANRYRGSVYELPTFSRGMNAFVLDTTLIDDLNYLLEKRYINDVYVMVNQG